jgi:hypothetical protein
MNLVHVSDYTFDPYQRTTFDVYLRADAEKRPRLYCKPRTKDRPNALDLGVVNRDRGLAGTDDTNYAGSGQDWHQAITRVEPAEQVAWEEREVQFFDPVGPAPPGAI